MKPIYRFLVLGILTMAMTAVSATSIFAQDPCAEAEVEAKQAVYKKFTDNYLSKVLAQREIAVEAGKEYIQKYGACADSKDIVTYLNSTIPGIEKKNATEKKAKATGDQYNRFDTALKAKNTADIFSVGKEILATDPELVDVMLVLATAGYDQATAKPPVDTYNNEAVNYAKSAIQKLDANVKSKTGDYGVLTYSYKDKENARGWMNYIIGFVNYYRLGKKDEGLPYLYKAAQATSSTTKSNPYLYQTFGSYYRDEVVRLGDEIVVKLKANNNQATDETKALIAMQKGYADRAVDSYARAYSVADKAPAGKDYRDGLYGSLKEIYNLRYEGKRTDVDVYANGVSSRPMPDPTTKVTPVAEEVAPATTTPATTTPSTTKPADASMNPSTTKPVTTMDDSKTSTKPMSSTTTTKPATTKVTVTKTDNGNSSSETTTTKTKTPAKKPAPKKKGTR